MNNKNHVILVTEQDAPIGTMEKLEAHVKGVLHRAFSVFILNDAEELLLQKRADNKYHSGGLWSNTCCSHPTPDENTIDAAHRRLQEEMGFDTELQPIFTLCYKADVGNGLIENEYDHVYLGYYSGIVTINPEEASNSKFIALDDLQKELKDYPQHYTPWLKLAMPDFLKHLEQQTA